MTYRIESRVFKAASAVTAAEYSAFCTSYHNALLDLGLVNTGDSGQYSLSGASSETFVTESRIKGYRMFRFNDALQATSPVFIKVWFGFCSTSVGAMPTVSLQIGTATDGAGNFVGISTPIRYPHAPGVHNGVQINVPTTNVYSAGPGYFISALHNNFKTSVPSGAHRLGVVCHSFFAIVRTVDSTGEPTADGVALIYQGEKPLAVAAAMASNLKIDMLSSLFGIRSVSMTALVPFDGQLTTIGGSPIVYPVLLPFANRMIANQLVLIDTDVANAGDTFSHTVLGTTPRNYFVPGKSFFPMDIGSTATYDPYPSRATVAILLEGSAV